MTTILDKTVNKLRNAETLDQIDIQNLLHSSYLCDAWRENDNETYRTNFIIRIDDQYYQISPTWDTAGGPMERSTYQQPIKVNKTTVPRVIETVRYVPQAALALDTGALITPDYFGNIVSDYLAGEDLTDAEINNLYEYITTEAPKVMPRRLMCAIREDDYIWDQLAQTIDEVAINFIRETIKKGTSHA